MMRKPGFLGFASGWKGLLVIGLLAATALVVVAGTAYWTRQKALEELRQNAANALAVYSVGLEEVMDKYRAVTVILSNRDDLRAILLDANPEITPEARERAIAFADRQSLLAAADELRIIRTDGEIVGTGGPVNRQHVTSGNVAYRSYFIDAMQGRLGRFLSLRAEEGAEERRGYVFAAPVRDGTRIIGVLALELGLSVVEAPWALSRDPVVALDAEGRVLLSNRANLEARSLRPPEGFGERPPAPLPQIDSAPSEVEAAFAGEVRLVELDLPGYDQEPWLSVDRPMPVLDWTLRMLSDPSAADRQALQAGVIALLVCLLAAGLVLLLLGRRGELLRRVRSGRAQALRLERRVRDRTRALQESNLNLAREVQEREAAEEELRHTQSELIQAAKLAVIGQMSTALSHEFNQPLGAIRSYSENAIKFLDLKREAEARDNLRLVVAVVERMATLSRHLKSFARKPGGGAGPVNLNPVVEEVVLLLNPRLKAEKVKLTIDAPQGVDYMVTGDRVHLSQVLVNIVSNAVDALAGQRRKELRLSWRLGAAGEAVEIKVEDSGPGIAPENLETIFDPFFTTKEVGEGLGIGLSIAYNIVRDLGGRLEASNRPEGGACFTLSLPLAERRRGAAQ